ncbi:MAG: hypothetical protein JNL98_23865 [Bryobacterales bacterium]|nr:hypothetical protein [Bryobacterales bacterium]
MAKLPVLFLVLLTIVSGQTVQMTASATVNGQNRFVIGTETNGVHLEFQPISATLNPPATGLAAVEIGIQKLGELNITSGCALTRYCPGDRVTRGQMASFLARAKTGLMPGEVFNGIDFPSAYGRDYIDVGPQHLFRLPIELIRRLGVTSGCYDNAYCPEDSTTRGQMAVFLVRAFFTP